MADYRLAKPPLIDTTIPTNENYYTRTISGVPAVTTPSSTTYAGLAPDGTGHSADPATWSNIALRVHNTVATLRSLNPTLSTQNSGDAITVGVTTAGTTISFNTPFIFNVYGVATPPPPVNFNHRYAIDAVGINAMALTPAGHGMGGDDGMWATFYTMDASSGGFPAARLAFHPRSRSIQEYASQWAVESDPLAVIPPDPNSFTYGVRADIASQRLGDYVYVFSSHNKLSVTSWALFNGIEQPSRYDQAQAISVKRIGPNRDIQTRIDFDCSTLSESGDLRSWIPHPGFAAGVQHQFFVSDDATLFIWSCFGDVSNLYGSSASGFSTNPVGWFGFADKGDANFGTLKQSQSANAFTVTGQLGAYLQVCTLPANIYAFGPTLVFPWRAGNYGPPELWYFVMNGVRAAATFDIYAAKWARNQYQRVGNLTLADDASFQSGARRFPTGNPDGYAFDHDWYRPANKLGTIGPFPNCDVWNQRSDPSGGSADLIRYPGFRVLRDCNRIGQMQFVMANNGARTGSGG